MTSSVAHVAEYCFTSVREQDTAHAAASVHATVMSEEDVQSEGETNLSSMRGRAQRSAPARTGHAHGHAGRPQHQSAGEMIQKVVTFNADHVLIILWGRGGCAHRYLSSSIGVSDENNLESDGMAVQALPL